MPIVIETRGTITDDNEFFRTVRASNLHEVVGIATPLSTWIANHLAARPWLVNGEDYIIDGSVIHLTLHAAWHIAEAEGRIVLRNQILSYCGTT